MHYQHGPISTVAGHYGKNILWPNAGVGPEDIDLTGSYDAFTFTTMLQLEDYGFCKKGEGGHYVSDGTMRLGGRRPNNTSGGHLCEGYTHGINMVIENVRQLRHDVDDSLSHRSRRQTAAHLRLPRGRLPAGEGLRGERQSRLGHAGHRLGHGHAARLRGHSMSDSRRLSRHAARGRATSTSRTSTTSAIALRTTTICSAATTAALLRYPPTTACPWCTSPKSNWVPVEAKGTVHSYVEVHHAIQPAFKATASLHDPAGRPRHAEGQAERARGAAGRRQSGRRQTASSPPPTW